MPAAVVAYTRPTGTRGHKEGNKLIRYFDWTSDTGTYTTGGFVVTAASLGFKHIDFVHVGSLATSGTAGVAALGVGVIYGTEGASITLQLYESAAANVLFAEKTSNEAMVANFTVRLRVEGN